MARASSRTHEIQRLIGRSLRAVADLAAGLGLTPDRELGYLAMFSSACLLVAGSLLPGI